MDNRIKELELNGWEVTAKDTGELEISKGPKGGKFILKGSANHVLKVAKKLKGDGWVELEEESEQHCMIESTVKLLDKTYGTRDGTQS